MLISSLGNVPRMNRCDKFYCNSPRCCSRLVICTWLDVCVSHTGSGVFGNDLRCIWLVKLLAVVYFGTCDNIEQHVTTGQSSDPIPKGPKFVRLVVLVGPFLR